MGEAPGQAIRKKKKSSIVLAVDAVAQGSSDAVVAAGSTGAAMASSLFGLGRLPGIDRPAIAVTLPTIKKPIVVIDGGAIVIVLLKCYTNLLSWVQLSLKMF